MPGGDGTGPNGMGPKTGRAAGYCAGYDMPGYASTNPGRRFFNSGGGFFGGGRGRRNWFRATGLPFWARTGQQNIQADPSVELEDLKSQEGYFKNALENINSRISELEKNLKKND